MAVAGTTVSQRDAQAAALAKEGQLSKACALLVKPKFTTDFLEAVVRKGADELTLKAHADGVFRTSIDTTNVPLVDEEWHPICQAISQGVEIQSGKPRVTTTRICTRRSKARNLKKKGKSAVGHERSQRHRSGVL